MKKFCLDLTVVAVERMNDRYVLIRLTHAETLPPMKPGQFVEVRVDHSPQTFLRRPISINYVDIERNEMGLLVATVGHGTHQMATLKAGETLNCVFPLGNPFTLPTSPNERFGRRKGFCYQPFGVEKRNVRHDFHLWTQTHDDGRSTLCSRKGHCMRGVTRKPDGLRYRCMPLLRGKNRRGKHLRMYGRTCV